MTLTLTFGTHALSVLLEGLLRPLSKPPTKTPSDVTGNSHHYQPYKEEHQTECDFLLKDREEEPAKEGKASSKQGEAKHERDDE